MDSVIKEAHLFLQVAYPILLLGAALPVAVVIGKIVSQLMNGKDLIEISPAHPEYSRIVEELELLIHERKRKELFYDDDEEHLEERL
jgi:hypothetical protein